MRPQHRISVTPQPASSAGSGHPYEAIGDRVLRNDLVGLLLVNRRTGCIEECNRKLAEFFGRLPSSLIGRHVSEFESFFASREQYQHLLVTWASGAPLRNVRIAGARPDGSVGHGLLTVEPLDTAGGGPELDIALLADVSDLARLEEQLRQAERLERIGRVAAEVANEVQTLLESIEAALDRTGPVDPRQRERLDEATRASARARALISILIPGDLPGDPAPEEPSMAAPAVPRITGTETILYLERDAERARTTAAFLGYMGYRVIHAASDNDALRLVSVPDATIDLAILADGAGRPRMVAELRRGRPGLPALLFSHDARARKSPDPQTVVVSSTVALADLALAVRQALTSAGASPRD
jgi:PAS domain S-box-containing protein